MQSKQICEATKYIFRQAKKLQKQAEPYSLISLLKLDATMCFIYYLFYVLILFEATVS